VIVGLVMAGFARGYKLILIQKREAALEETYDVVRGALRNFIARDINPDPAVTDELGRYSCPADPAAAPESAAYGVEQRADGGDPNVPDANCNVTGGMTAVNVPGGRVIVGAVPTRTLEISSRHMLDPYGNRLTYAVTENLARQKGAVHMNLPGAITISPTIAGPPITGAHFTLVFHGRTGAGSFTADGIQNPEACKADNRGDSENCDGDAVFSELPMALADTPDFSDDTLAFTLTNSGANQFLGPVTPLHNNVHTPQQCYDAGGYVRGVGGGDNLCAFGGGCPAGWTAYLNWSATAPDFCDIDRFDECSSCSTRGHAWSNTAQETCHYSCNPNYICYSLILESGCY
jgi:hypothetical protein